MKKQEKFFSKIIIEPTLLCIIIVTKIIIALFTTGRQKMQDANLMQKRCERTLLTYSFTH